MSRFRNLRTARRNTYFEYSASTDPHFHRRKAILRDHPEVRALMGFDRWQVLPALLCIAVQVGLACYFARANTSWGLITLAALLLGAVLNHWLCMAIHEAAHDLFFRTRGANLAWAIFVNIPVLIPLAISFRKYHLNHHRHLGWDTVDSDLPSSVEVIHVGNKPWRKVLWLLLNNVAYVFRAREKAVPPTPLEWVNVSVVMLTNLGLVLWLGPKAFVYLLLSSLIGLSFHPVAGHFIHEHFVFEPGQETNSYYGWLNLVCYNVGYHNEHHDFMNIPGSRLPALKAMAPEYYDHLVSHRSWLWVQWSFVLGRRVGLHSRIVRTESDFYRYRRLGSRGD